MLKVTFVNDWSGATFVVRAGDEAGKLALARMEAMPSWRRV